MRQEIQNRYTEESACCSDLSCGSNLHFLQVAPGESILDLGCGKGADTIAVAKLTGPEGKAVGLDITEAMLDVAKINALNSGAGNTEFVFGDIEHLPFANNSFDAVMSNCVINHAKDKKRVYGEIFRVLKPEGRFVISDAVTKESLPEHVKNDPEAWAQCYGGAVTETEYLDSIRSSGFPEIKILSRREYIKNTYDFISLTIMATKK